jgi:hypothetical protein
LDIPTQELFTTRITAVSRYKNCRKKYLVKLTNLSILPHNKKYRETTVIERDDYRGREECRLIILKNEQESVIKYFDTVGS